MIKKPNKEKCNRKAPYIIQLFRSKLFYLWCLFYAMGQALTSLLWFVFIIILVQNQINMIIFPAPFLAVLMGINFFGSYAYAINQYIKTRRENK